MSVQDPWRHIWKLMDEIGVAMLVTHAGDRNLRARPMAARVEAEDNAVYFLTDANAPKDQEIAHEAHVCLAFADPKSMRFVSIAGFAEVFEDVAMAKRLWRPMDKAFFSGASDPHIRIVRVTPETGECWEGSGLLATVASMVKAGATGRRAKLGENAKVPM